MNDPTPVRGNERSAIRADAQFGPGRRWAQSRLLLGLPGVRHAVSTRLMMRDPAERAALVRRLAEELGWPLEAVVLAEQTHSARIACVGAAEAKRLAGGGEPHVFPGADALIVAAPHVVAAIFTADCVPILFADPEAPLAGAVHAGWRGTMGRILRGALERALELGARAERLRLWIGPAISGERYEVSQELAAQFAEAFPAWAGEAVRGRHVDLPAINRREALALGLRDEHVALSGLCTGGDPRLLCSHRADAGQAGRMASAIVLD